MIQFVSSDLLTHQVLEECKYQRVITGYWHDLPRCRSFSRMTRLSLGFFLASCLAVAQPRMPPPTMATSYTFFCISSFQTQFIKTTLILLPRLRYRQKDTYINECTCKQKGSFGRKKAISSTFWNQILFDEENDGIFVMRNARASYSNYLPQKC